MDISLETSRHDNSLFLQPRDNFTSSFADRLRYFQCCDSGMCVPIRGGCDSHILLDTVHVNEASKISGTAETTCNSPHPAHTHTHTVYMLLAQMRRVKFCDGSQTCKNSICSIHGLIRGSLPKVPPPPTPPCAHPFLYRRPPPVERIICKINKRGEVAKDAIATAREI